MRVIDHKNIDEWLFDYFEGNLGQEEKKELTSFLHKNPLLKADFDAWKMSYVREPEIVYPEVNSLLRTKTAGSKWIKGGLALVVLLSLLLLYLFYPAKENAKKPVSENENGIPVTKNINNIGNENVIAKEPDQKTILNTQQKLNLPPGPHILKEKNVTEQPEDMRSVMQKSLGIYYQPANDSVMKIVLPTEKPISPSDTVKKKEKKEMKIIRLRNTGL